MLRMGCLYFRKFPNETFPPIPPMSLQNTDIKDKFLVFAILNSNGTSKAMQEEERLF